MSSVRTAARGTCKLLKVTRTLLIWFEDGSIAQQGWCFCFTVPSRIFHAPSKSILAFGGMSPTKAIWSQPLKGSIPHESTRGL